MKIGSLFSGVGGLDLAVEQVTGASPAWFVEFDAAPSKVLANHWPDVPNYGDVTAADWSTVEPVDILTAGYPCQPFSHAGLRKGHDDDRHLWPHVEVAIGALRPRWVVLENVAGHLTLGGPAVIGSLTGLGYDARWGIVRASDAGAPHQRARLFIVAHPAGASKGQFVRPRGLQAQPRRGNRLADGGPYSLTTAAHTSSRQFAWPAIGADGLPVASERGDVAADTGSQRHGKGEDTGRLGPVDRPDEGSARQRQRARQESRDRGVAANWGPYAAAIARWEHVLGEPAPAPTVTGTNGRQRLNPDLPRWMMGFPPGWLDGLTSAQQLKAAGNAVCPQQCALALQLLGVSWQT